MTTDTREQSKNKTDENLIRCLVSVIERNGGMYCLVNVENSSVIATSPSLFQTLGIVPSEDPFVRYQQLFSSAWIHPEDRSKVLNTLLEANFGQTTQINTVTVRLKTSLDGYTAYNFSLSSFSKNEHGAAQVICVMAEESERAFSLGINTGLLARAVEKLATGVTIWKLEDPRDPKSFKLIYKNEAATHRTETSLLPLKEGLSASEVFGGRIDYAKLNDAYLNQSTADLGRLTYKFKCGLEKVLSVKITGMGKDHVVALSDEVTEQVLLEKQIELEKAKTAVASKLSSLGEMAAGIAHEINSPLSVIYGQTELLLCGDELDPLSANVKRSLLLINSMVERVNKIVAGMRALSRDGSFDPLSGEDLNAIVLGTTDFCRCKITDYDIELRLKLYEGSLPIQCRGSQVSQIIVNLIGNSCDAIAKLPVKWIEISSGTDDGHVFVTVTDSGGGIPAEIVSKIMDPFFTTKGVYKGTGLGLSISKGIATSHGGDLYVDELCSNTRFILRLPKA